MPNILTPASQSISTTSGRRSPILMLQSPCQALTRDSDQDCPKVPARGMLRVTGRQL